ncbi:anti-FecI sigma factor FecR [Alcanivorax sp. 521-1]|uniref:Anti-FecI sigma factor FecR n=1 Tax=Alloalcanivorax profundimaris TaxID=2735259 RepID=A0ABS0ATM3_9GAMM|nr:FecR domain-containing protein [Alloalcanivorax profundimaris]MBF5056826.1 anti-FecI sigma factor FecR [Alloalcanivorax profundimaris]
MSVRDPAGPDYHSLEQAAEWFATLGDDDVSAAEREAWRCWLEANPRHRRAWDYVESVGRRFGRLRDDGDPHLAGGALDRAREQRLSRRQALKGLAVLATGGALGWAGWRHSPLPELARAWRADYRTPVGGRRALVLDDGTGLWLNTNSALNVDYDADRRRLTLVAGEVLVDTGADPRPLWLTTGDGELRPLGTRFRVRREEGDTEVAVYQGAVRVRAADSGAERTVPAGRRTRFDGRHIAPLASADPARLAWTRGLLIAEERPLGELVAELARYRHGHLAVDPAVAGLPVMGTYPLDDTDRALAMLEAALPVRVRRRLPWWVTLEPAAD